ncbi:MAG: DUF2798 domain-containing protein [Clostridiales bacterium]
MLNELWFDRIVNISVNIALGLALTFTVSVINNTVSLGSFVLGFIPGFCIGYVLGDLLPLQKIGGFCADGLGCRPDSLLYSFVEVGSIGLIMVTGISFFCTLVGAGFQGFWGRWLSAYPILLFVGIILDLIFLPLSIKLAVYLTKNNTAN